MWQIDGLGICYSLQKSKYCFYRRCMQKLLNAFYELMYCTKVRMMCCISLLSR